MTDKALEQQPILPHGLGRIAQRHISKLSLFTLANSLTLIRIFISPIFLLIYLQYQTLGISHLVLPYILLCLLGISELSDAFDGFLARRYNQVTDLGKILDPMADSISRISVFLTFTQPPVNIPLITVFIFLWRDSMISTLRTICALRGFALAARPSGKIKAIVQAVVIFIITTLLIPHSLGQLSQESLSQLSTIFVFIAIFYAIYSGIDYFLANRHHIVRILLRKKNKRI
jgi:CDP-diacylglycerol--glycerol-3-phosphate 3-phosphatidyltransferase